MRQKAGQAAEAGTSLVSVDSIPLSRRQAVATGLRVLAASAAGALAAACRGGGEAPSLPFATTRDSEPRSLGRGGVKVGLILPLGAGGEIAIAAQSLRNAAELALAELPDANVELLVKDDGGTPEGARNAAQQALGEGAELLLGPLLAASVQAAGQVATAAGKPVIAFSTDANVASRGVYLLSFLPENEVERIVAYAASQRRRRLAALIPETPYGEVVAAAFQKATAALRVSVEAIERYGAGDGEPIGRVAVMGSGDNPQIDALLVPEGGERLAALVPALQNSGFDFGKVKLLGTGVWNEARALRLPALAGGWFAAPDPAGFQSFAGRYTAKFGQDPSRIASLSYDSVSLVAALARTQGAQRFSEPVLTGAAGFNGADGVFRFRRDGTNDRGLSVLEVRAGAAEVISAAPKTLGTARG